MLLLVLISLLFTVVSAVTIYPGTEFEVENETYTVSHVMEFSSITIADTYIIFNTTGFYLTSVNDIYITLDFIHSNMFQVGNGNLALQFDANTYGSNTVTFSLSGFVPGSDYEIRRDGTIISTSTANSGGYIYFSNNVWSNHEFKVYQTNMGSDNIPPVISNIVVVSSNPKDTNPAFGWENFTCTVTDNVQVNQVKIHIIYPDSSSSNISMNHISGTNNYYYRTSFTQHGSYNYKIWAQDTSGNTATSSNYVFPLPPNWDVNSNGQCNILDFTLVSNHYTEMGNPGWIREDVDNSGAVKILDLVLVSNHYGETWS